VLAKSFPCMGHSVHGSFLVGNCLSAKSWIDLGGYQV
jgi:hypothetical protein